ncbi:MAG: thioredoxin family protein [Firmicutes bacterium]|nr:thioredoxin family protein [Alicyclobacillaceae bacterium]MCL6496088.1 thioredoxin family protein [Bacillota bacterium]
MRLAQEMARANPGQVTADMIDAESFMRLSERAGVFSVPLTWINGGEQVVGAVPESQLVKKIQSAMA